jgi:hypothetical protein
MSGLPIAVQMPGDKSNKSPNALDEPTCLGGTLQFYRASDVLCFEELNGLAAQLKSLLVQTSKCGGEYHASALA